MNYKMFKENKSWLVESTNKSTEDAKLENDEKLQGKWPKLWTTLMNIDYIGPKKVF